MLVLTSFNGDCRQEEQVSKVKRKIEEVNKQRKSEQVRSPSRACATDQKRMMVALFYAVSTEACALGRWKFIRSCNDLISRSTIQLLRTSKYVSNYKMPIRTWLRFPLLRADRGSLLLFGARCQPTQKSARMIRCRHLDSSYSFNEDAFTQNSFATPHNESFQA